MALADGATFGPYRDVQQLGRGGMASVYSAHEASLDRRIALKVLPAEFLHDETFAERFRREAKAVARLEHPNIVPIYAFGIEAGVPWMAMRLVKGGALSTIVKRGRLDPARAVAILKGTAEALTYAHLKGVVHRDVKPQNILLDENERVYLADFGIAKMLEGSNKLTQTGMISGTPQYMAPEQAMATTIDGRADIYALGIVAYELLTGRVPFSADTPVAVLMKHVQEPIPIPSPEEVKGPLVRVLLKALAKKPDDRWPSAVAFVAALESALDDEPTATMVPTLEMNDVSGDMATLPPPAPSAERPAMRPSVPAATRPPRAPASSWAPTAAPATRPDARPTTAVSTAAIGVSGVAALVVVATLGFWLLRRPSSEPHQGTPSPAPGVVAASNATAPSPSLAAPASATTEPHATVATVAAPLSRPAASPPPATRPLSPPATAPAPAPERKETPAVEAPSPTVPSAPAGPSPEVQSLVQGLTDRSPNTRWKAAEALGNLADEAAPAVPSLVEGLTDRTAVVRWRSAEALGKIGATSAMGPLAAALKDPDSLVRTESAKALARFGPKAKGAVPALAVALGDTDVYCRRQAAKALVAMGVESRVALEALVEGLKDKDKFVRLESARALGQIGPEARAAVPALTVASKDGEPLVARGAAEALRRIATLGSAASQEERK